MSIVTQGGPKIPIPMWRLEEALDMRIGKQGMKIEDLFLCVKSWDEGEIMLDTKYGKLRVFFVREPQGKLSLFHKKWFDYPKISSVKKPKSLLVITDIVDEYVN